MEIHLITSTQICVYNAHMLKLTSLNGMFVVGYIKCRSDLGSVMSIGINCMYKNKTAAL